MGKILPYGNILNVNELGELVRRFRKENGWRIEDVAGIANVGSRFISEFERGKETVEIGKVLKVLNALGLEVLVHPRHQGDLGMEEPIE